MRTHTGILLTAVMAAQMLLSCSPVRKMERSAQPVGLSQTAKRKLPTAPPAEAIEANGTNVTIIKRDNGISYLTEIEYEEDGAAISKIDIEKIVVTSSLKSVPERFGFITIDFLVNIPKELQQKDWSIIVTPLLHRTDTTIRLDPVVLRGPRVDRKQDREYQRRDRLEKRLEEIDYNRYTLRNEQATVAERRAALFGKPAPVYTERAAAKRKRRDAHEPGVWQSERNFRYVTEITQPTYPEARLDSVVTQAGNIRYHYSQNIRADENNARMKLTLEGRARDFWGRELALEARDTLSYTVTSMTGFIDRTPRYIYRIIEKYATVNDRNWITFPLGKSRIIDTLGNNRTELEKMTSRMNTLLNQYEFFIDSIVLTAACSPEGSIRVNDRISRARAHAVRDYLAEKFGDQVDTLIEVRWIGEDWDNLIGLLHRSRELEHSDGIIDIIRSTDEPDRRDVLIRRAYPDEYEKMREELYPKLRSVNLKYSLRRVGMVKDTVYTTELDSAYMRGVELLEKKDYRGALKILDPYKDINSAITLMSLGYDKQAYEIMVTTPDTPQRNYMLAILCARSGRIEQGLKFYSRACAADPALEYRGNLDPEIQFLLRRQDREE